MYIYIIILPLIILIIISIWGRYLSYNGIYWLINIMMMELLIIVILINNEIWINNNKISIELKCKFGELWEECRIIYDEINSIILLMLIIISWIVIIYTYDYMIMDPHKIRFNYYIIWFILSMIILIIMDNLIYIFIGWEGLGITSFLLITYWFTRLETNWGGLIAICINKLGDIFYIILILLSYIIYKTSDINIINIITMNNLTIIIIILYLTASVKSAQLYFHIWLPFSMEGPTPISALIHAATLVTAGIYLLIRLSFIFHYNYYLIMIISILGGLTSFIAGSLAITSIDMKELIAYSTMSQLGYMIIAIGIKLYNLALFHLIFHAYFKALLFLIIGSILHTILDIQDLRFTGSLKLFIPISYILLLYGINNLIGLPFTTGFYSKESIILYSFNFNFFNSYIFLFTLITALFTFFYSFKLIYYLFFNTTNLSLFLFKHLHFFSLHLILATSLLALFSLILGFLLFKFHLFLDLNFFFINHHLNYFLKFIPFSFYFIIFFLFHSSFSFTISFSLFTSLFGFKSLYLFISAFLYQLAYRILYKLFDFGFIDLLFPLIYSNQLFPISSFIHSYFNLHFIWSLFFFFILFFFILL